MKKFTIIILTLLALTAWAGISAAEPAQLGVPLDDLTVLANYAPENVPFFAAIRTDDAYIDELDGLLASLIDKLPPDTAPPEYSSLRDLLNAAFAEGTDGAMSFDEDARPWLGDTIAVFVPSLEVLMGGADLPVVMGATITDQAALNDFVGAVLEDALANQYYQRIEREDGSILYQGTFFSSPSVLILEDAVFVGILDDEMRPLVLPGQDRVKLSLTSPFRDAMDALPEDHYNAVLYTDIVDGIRRFGPMFTMQLPPELQGMFDASEIADMLGQQAVGLVTLQDRSLVMDVVSTGDMGMVSSPLDPDFLAHVPADTALLLQNNGLADQVRYLLGLLDKADDLLTDLGVYPLEDAGPFANLQLHHLGTFLKLSFEGSTGLDFDTTLDWMNGDHALFVSLPTGAEPVFGFDMGFSVQSGLVMATDNPGETAAYVEALAGVAADMFTTATYEDGLVNIPLGDLISKPELGNIAVGSNQDVIAAGDRQAVEFALNPGDQSITSTPTFTFEQGVFLPETGFLAYIDLAPVRAALTAFYEANPDQVRTKEAAGLRSLLSMFDTASITATCDDTGGKIRFSLTLGE
jgi:hypothetical protein